MLLTLNMLRSAMKEIDFLPSWYRNSRRRSIGYKWQYGIITATFVFMAGWSFIAGRIVSSTTAGVETVNVERSISNEIEKINIEITDLQAKAQLLEKCSTNIKFSSVIAELSLLIDPAIVLNRLQINAQDASVILNESQGVRAVVNRNTKAKSSTLENNKVYKVIINGIAKSPKDVADLLFNLEDSSYFKAVVHNFSQNKKIDDHYVTEFEISCNIANYKIKAD